MSIIINLNVTQIFGKKAFIELYNNGLTNIIDSNRYIVQNVNNVILCMSVQDK